MRMVAPDPVRRQAPRWIAATIRIHTAGCPANEHGCSDFLYGRSDLFVLPTFSENFGVAVAEALAHGLPVITTNGAPWADLEAFLGSRQGVNLLLFITVTQPPTVHTAER